MREIVMITKRNCCDDDAKKLGKAECDAIDLAHYIINKETESGLPITNIRLQQYLYVMQIVRMKSKNRRLIDGKFYVSHFGPVIMPLYKDLLIWGGARINRVYPDALSNSPKSLVGFVDDGIRYLNGKSPYALSQVTLKDGGAWSVTYDGGMGLYQEISDELIFKQAKSYK